MSARRQQAAQARLGFAARQIVVDSLVECSAAAAAAAAAASHQDDQLWRPLVARMVAALAADDPLLQPLARAGSSDGKTLAADERRTVLDRLGQHLSRQLSLVMRVTGSSGEASPSARWEVRRRELEGELQRLEVEIAEHCTLAAQVCSCCAD